MKVSKSSADAMFPFNTPTGNIQTVKQTAKSSNAQETFNDFQCVPETNKSVETTSAASHLQFY